MSTLGFGWNSHWEKVYSNANHKGSPGRVIKTQDGYCELWTESGIRSALLRCREPVIVGDWITYREPGDGTVVVENIMPRKSTISRQAAGNEREQILVVNVDWVLIISSLDQDVNTARLARYLATVWNCGASPAMVLTKPDLCDDVDGVVSSIEEVAPGVPIHIVNPVKGEGMDDLAPYLGPRCTTVLTGATGVGKSYLINAVLGADPKAASPGGYNPEEEHQVLFPLPAGGVLVDSPGIRELGMWVDEAALKDVFIELEQFAESCRFRNCQHLDEPGCAVLAAVNRGDLTRRRYNDYIKMRIDDDSMALRDEPLRLKARDKVLHKAHKKFNKEKFDLGFDRNLE